MTMLKYLIFAGFLFFPATCVFIAATPARKTDLALACEAKHQAGDQERLRRCMTGMPDTMVD